MNNTLATHLIYGPNLYRCNAPVCIDVTRSEAPTLVLVNTIQHTERNFLEKIMQSCACSSYTVEKIAGKPLQLPHQNVSKIVLSFGLMRYQLQALADGAFMPYTIYPLQKIRFLPAPHLSMIYENKRAKQQLWAQLKLLFMPVQ